MKIYFNGQGSISAAGTSMAAPGRYAAGERTWSADPATGLPVYRVSELPDRPDVRSFVAERRPDRLTELALYAAADAVEQAGWTGKDFSILVGSSRGPTQSWESGFDLFRKEGRVPARTSPRTTLGSPAFALADFFGTRSLAAGMSVTCSSGFHALLQSVALLRSGMVDRVLVGGAEAPLTAFTLSQMSALRITADIPKENGPASRPLRSPASGMALGEGAAFFALSREPGPFELTSLRFAREAVGSATGISPEGDALRQTMRAVIKEAGWPDFIVAHAPGTRRGDAAELTAIATIYNDTPEDQVVTSFKWATGHTFGASGPLALDAALRMMAAGRWMPLPYGGIRQTPWALGNAIVNATGFGGNAISVGIRKVLPSPSPPID